MDKARVDLCQRSAATLPMHSARAQFLHAAKALVAADDNQALTQNIVNVLRASIMDFEASLAASDPEPLKTSALSNVGDGSDDGAGTAGARRAGAHSHHAAHRAERFAR